MDSSLKEEKESSTTSMRDSKRRRKNINPTHLNTSRSTKGTSYCKNLACQAILRREDLFCKRCSCCICLKYDENKDPILWLTCDSDPPIPRESCGLWCHLNCAFEREKSGLKEDKPSNDMLMDASTVSPVAKQTTCVSKNEST